MQPSPAQPQPSPAQPSPAPAQPSPCSPAHAAQPMQPSPCRPAHAAQPSPCSPAQPSPAQPSPAQPSPAQPSPAQPSPAQPSPTQPSRQNKLWPALSSETEHIWQWSNHKAPFFLGGRGGSEQQGLEGKGRWSDVVNPQKLQSTIRALWTLSMCHSDAPFFPIVFLFSCYSHMSH